MAYVAADDYSVRFTKVTSGSGKDLFKMEGKQEIKRIDLKREINGFT